VFLSDICWCTRAFIVVLYQCDYCYYHYYHFYYYFRLLLLFPLSSFIQRGLTTNSNPNPFSDTGPSAADLFQRPRRNSIHRSESNIHINKQTSLLTENDKDLMNGGGGGGGNRLHKRGMSMNLEYLKNKPAHKV
jgi:hypothetical protein